jgi:WD40 repeat protein
LIKAKLSELIFLFDILCKVILYDGKTGERLSELGAPAAHAGSIYGLCWDSTSRFILTASGDKTAKIWDVTTGSAVQ